MKFHTHRVLEESIPYWSVIRLSHPVFCSILNYSLDSCTGVNIHLLGYSIEVEIQRWRPSSSFFPLNNERPTLRKDKCCVKPRAKWSRSTFGLGTSPSPSPWPCALLTVLWRRNCCTHTAFFALLLKRETGRVWLVMGGNHAYSQILNICFPPPTPPFLDEIWDTDHYFHGFWEWALVRGTPSPIKPGPTCLSNQ